LPVSVINQNPVRFDGTLNNFNDKGRGAVGEARGGHGDPSSAARGTPCTSEVERDYKTGMYVWSHRARIQISCLIWTFTVHS